MTALRLAAKTGCVVLTVVGFSGLAAAGPDDRGYYASFALGIAADFDEDRFDLPGDAFDTNIDYSLGYAGILGGVGYSFGNGFRVEGSLGYTRQDVGSLSTSSSVASLGDAIFSELMVTGYYDFRRGRKFQPYVGLGLGGARLSYKGTTIATSSGATQVRESDIHPTGQVVLGLGWWTSERVFLGFEYNYITSLGDFDVSLSSGSEGGAHFDTNRLLVKLRYTFN